MAISNVKFSLSAVALEDLSNTTKGSGAVYKAFDAKLGTITAIGSVCTGIVCEGTKLNGNVPYTFLGNEKYTAGAAVADGASLTITTSGYFTTAASGDFVVGTALSAVASGEVGTGIFNFATKVTKTL